MPKGSKEWTEHRRKEIIDACAKLYQQKRFKEITMQDIADVTTFTRTSIYNYFQTKEEIFLALFAREYEAWTAHLHTLRLTHPTLSADAFAQAFAHSLQSREMMLKLLSMNHYDLEENSRETCLIAFKRVYGLALAEVENCLMQWMPQFSRQRRQDFLYGIFPFMFGIYPYTHISEKQRSAMKAAGVAFVEQSIYDITYAQVRMLLQQI